MATSGTSQTANTGRPLPKLRSPNPPGASSDETPRTVASDGSARQRRRVQQQTGREKTPNGRETISPSPAKEVTGDFQSISKEILCLAAFTTSIRTD